jgi:16S rRNA processing protein RimM
MLFVCERRRSSRLSSGIRSDQDCAPLSWTSERADALFRPRASEEGSGFQAQSSASGASNQARSEQLNTVIVGVIGRPHGVRGEVAVELRTDEPERRFAPGQVLGEEGGSRRFTVSSVRDQSSRLLVKFAELDDLAAADAVRGTVLISTVEPDERPVEPDAFYDRQLIGLRVTTPAGGEVGAVRSVLHLPAQDVLEVETATGSRLVPFVAALVPEVDLEAGCLTVVDIAGLLDDRDNADED